MRHHRWIAMGDFARKSVRDRFVAILIFEDGRAGVCLDMNLHAFFKGLVSARLLVALLAKPVAYQVGKLMFLFEALPPGDRIAEYEQSERAGGN